MKDILPGHVLQPVSCSCGRILRLGWYGVNSKTGISVASSTESPRVRTYALTESFPRVSVEERWSDVILVFAQDGASPSFIIVISLSPSTLVVLRARLWSVPEFCHTYQFRAVVYSQELPSLRRLFPARAASSISPRTWPLSQEYRVSYTYSPLASHVRRGDIGTTHSCLNDSKPM